MIQKPKLEVHQFSVGHALHATGQVLEIDKKSFFLGKGDVYLIFDSELEALEYMKQTILEMPDIECWMEDSSGKHIVTIGRNGERY